VPTASIEIRRKYSPAEETGLIAAVRAAITGALKVPDSTTSIRLFVHEAHRFSVPPDKDDRFALVTIDCFIGRSAKTKRRLYEAMTANLGLCGIPADQLKVLVREAPRENWGIRGGQPASQVPLEYDVNI
jgi:phenylpyruvate tautomerase PptA (4-oxalocrotonate tautomerase family)